MRGDHGCRPTRTPPPTEIQSHHVHKVDDFKDPLPHRSLISLQLLVLKGDDVVKQPTTQTLTLVTRARPPSYHAKIADEVELQVFLLLEDAEALPATRHFLSISHFFFFTGRSQERALPLIWSGCVLSGAQSRHSSWCW